MAENYGTFLSMNSDYLLESWCNRDMHLPAVPLSKFVYKISKPGKLGTQMRVNFLNLGPNIFDCIIHVFAGSVGSATNFNN